MANDPTNVISKIYVSSFETRFLRSFRDSPRLRIDAKQRGEMAGMSHSGIMDRRACTKYTYDNSLTPSGLKKNERQGCVELTQ